MTAREAAQGAVMADAALTKATARLREATARQREAADPDISAWVSANAGTGPRRCANTLNADATSIVLRVTTIPHHSL